MTVCFAVDDYLLDLDKTMWVAELSDNTTVYQDDDRPGLEPIAWIRLRKYLYDNNLHIKRLLIKFRSHIEVVGSSDYGYFFRRGALGIYGSNRTVQRYVFGMLNEDNVFDVRVYNVPELILDENEGISVRPNVNHEDSVIYNNPRIKKE